MPMQPDKFNLFISMNRITELKKKKMKKKQKKKKKNRNIKLTKQIPEMNNFGRIAVVW